MTLKPASLSALSFAVFLSTASAHGQALNGDYARDPNQPLDQQYSEHIRKYTTDPSFISPLVDYLPASKTVPTPAKVLSDVSGAPDVLPYAEDVYKYFRMLEAASPRVKVFSIGHTEEGREMIAAAVADPEILAGANANKSRLAQLADPRAINFDDGKARDLITRSYPVYYITGTIHSPETGAPTALMELAYRLAVDDAPYIKYIRSHMIVLITPVVEVDGRDRMVDIYKWHKANPDKDWPRLLYWGHYVAHDNNRDAMGMTLALTRNVLDTYIDWHAQVLHDLHESVPFLYDNTVGDGPYNAWVDPALADEWAELGWNNVSQMQSFGMPGVFTHGDFDTWSPGYLMFLAGMHNGISRLYETFGNGGADTEKRILTPEEYSRTWYRQNPPLPVVNWSQRDNNNYEETALLTTLSYFAQHAHHFLENFYEKSKRAAQKPTLEGPAAYLIANDNAHANRVVELVKALRRQHVEVQQLSAATTCEVPGEKRGDKPKAETFPAGSVIVRMDQPYSRAADALLDRQFWAPDDPQKHPYDDTGWSFSQLFNLKVSRITDTAILKAAMKPVDDPAALVGILDEARPDGLDRNRAQVAVANTGETTLLGLIYKLKGARIEAVEKPFDAGDKHFAAGSLLINGVGDDALRDALRQLALDGIRLSVAPMVASHAVTAPRIAIMHTWLATQTEGWWRYAFDTAGVPYDYISTQTAARQDDLRAKYDVIVFAPVSHASAQDIINGVPQWRNPMPWQKTDLTPNLIIDSTDDIRPGLGYDGLEHLKRFVEEGGLLITCEDTAQFAIDTGLAPGVSVAPAADARVVGTVLNTVFVARDHPVANGYDLNLPVMSANGMAFNVSNVVGHSNPRILMDPYAERPTGRGSLEENDEPQGRKIVEAEPIEKQQPWEPRKLNEEQVRNNPSVIPPQYRPEVILRFSDAKTMLLSGLLDKAGSIAEHAVVVDAHLGQGNVLLFAINPIYRGETIGTYGLVFNAIMNHDRLGHEQVKETVK